MAGWNVGKMRHRVDVYEPVSQSLNSDSRGQRAAADKLIRANVPCSIQTISGREAALANQLQIEVTLMVRMNGDPAKPMTARQRLNRGGVWMEVAHVNDVNQDGRNLELLCGETK